MLLSLAIIIAGFFVVCVCVCECGRGVVPSLRDDIAGILACMVDEIFITKMVFVMVRFINTFSSTKGILALVKIMATTIRCCHF